MKKIYLQPQMELTECVMMRATICEGSPQPGNPDQFDPFGGAPERKVF